MEKFLSDSMFLIFTLQLQIYIIFYKITTYYEINYEIFFKVIGKPL